MLVNSRDYEATRARRFLSRNSYVSFRVHPGTKHCCQYLKGKDVEPMRLHIFERDKGKCGVCGAYYGWAFGEMDHIEGGYGPQRCDCAENLRWLCPKCHRTKHHRDIQWRPREADAAQG